MTIGIYIALGCFVLALIIIVLTGYVKAAPDEAIIISGLKKQKRFLLH